MKRVLLKGHYVLVLRDRLSCLGEKRKRDMQKKKTDVLQVTSLKYLQSCSLN